MSVLKDYVINILAVSLLAAIFDILLPEGNIKKYASAVIGLAVAAVIILPVSGILGGEILLPDFSATEAAADEEEYITMLEREFCDRAEQIIEEKSGGSVRAEVSATISNDTTVDKVIIYGNPDSGTMFYITNELGVSRDAVEIR